jgi:hypothetical protein
LELQLDQALFGQLTVLTHLDPDVFLLYLFAVLVVY